MPEPDGPIKPTLSPFETLKEMSRKIVTSPAFPRKVKPTLDSDKMGEVMLNIPLGRAFTGYGAVAACRKLISTFCALMAMSAPVHAEIVIAALGDSLTQGYGLAQNEGFVPQLERWLEDQGTEVRIINAGVSGDTTAGGLSRIEWTLTDDVQALIVGLGGNDLLRGIDPLVSRENLHGILTIARDNALPVLLIGMQAPGNYGPDYKSKFDAMYPDLAAEFGTIWHPSFLGAIIGEGLNTRALMQADGLHPNAAGVAEIVKDIGPNVLALVQRAGGD